MKKLNRIVVGLAVLLAVSCGKESKNEDPAPEVQTQNPVQNPAPKTCQLIYQSQGSPSLYYTNDSTGKVIRITSPSPFPPDYGFYQELLYNADGNIEEVKNYNGNNELNNYQVYTYNADKLPETITNYSVYTNGPIYQGYALFEYNAAKQLIKKSLLGPSQSVSTNYTVYTYPAPDQSKEEIYSADASGNIRLVSTTITHYDNKKSPYSLLNFMNQRMLISKHNDIATFQTNHTTGATHNYTRVYEYNDEDFPVKVTTTTQGNNFPSTMTWTYNCQ